MTPPARDAHPRPPLDAVDREHVLRHTADLWREYGPDLRIFVTGGTGFFGCWLLETFAHANTALRLGARLAVLTRDPEAFARRLPHLAADPAIALVRGDVRDLSAGSVFDGLAGAGWPRMAGPGFGAVVHAATAAHATGDAQEVLDAEIEGTRRALAFARETGARRLLFTSSGAVYGPQPGTVERIPEDGPGGPDILASNAAYAEGKRVAEFLCACAARRDGLAATIARAFAFVGPHLPVDGHFAIGNFLGDRLAGRPIRVKGDGKPVRSYLYAADLAVWLWTILFRGTPGRAYNVGAEEAHTVAEAAAVVARTDASNLSPVTVESAHDPRTVPAATLSSHGRYVPSTQRAREELGLHQTVPLPDAVRRTLAWARGGLQ